MRIDFGHGISIHLSCFYSSISGTFVLLLFWKKQNQSVFYKKIYENVKKGPVKIVRFLQNIFPEKKNMLENALH